MVLKVGSPQGILIGFLEGVLNGPAQVTNSDAPFPPKSTLVLELVPFWILGTSVLSTEPAAIFSQF